MSKCSAILASVVAPFLGLPRAKISATGGSRMRCDRALWGGTAAAPLRQSRNCRKSRDGGVATPWSVTGMV